MNQRRDRMHRLEGKLRTVPVRPVAVRAAFERFRETGDLPDDDRLARAVIKRVRLGPKLADLYDSDASREAIMRAAVCTPEQPEDEVMESLWMEAIDAPGTIRVFARAALRGLTANGLDPTTRAFADLGVPLHLPDYGSVGMFILGYPKSFAVSPYKQQVRRLFARSDKLRQRINQDDRRWFDTFGKALGAFLDYGEVPEEGLLRDAVLAGAEVEALMLNALGNDVADCLAALDSAARATGPDVEVAIASLRHFAAEGQFRMPQADRSIDPSGDHARPLRAARLPSARRSKAPALEAKAAGIPRFVPPT